MLTAGPEETQRLPIGRQLQEPKKVLGSVNDLPPQIDEIATVFSFEAWITFDGYFSVYISYVKSELRSKGPKSQNPLQAAQ